MKTEWAIMLTIKTNRNRDVKLGDDHASSIQAPQPFKLPALTRVGGYTDEEAAKIFRRSVRTYQRWRKRGIGPDYFRHGGDNGEPLTTPEAIIRHVQARTVKAKRGRS